MIIANAKTHEPIDILPNRRKGMMKNYLYRYGSNVEIVVMDANPSFKAAVKQALGRPLIIAGCYTGFSEELKRAYELKEADCEWFDWAKTAEDVSEVKRKLEAFYHEVEEAKIPVFYKNDRFQF